MTVILILENFNSKILQTFSKSNIQCLKNCQNCHFWASRIIQIDFTLNFGGRKIIKIPHCALWEECYTILIHTWVTDGKIMLLVTYGVRRATSHHARHNVRPSVRPTVRLSLSHCVPKHLANFSYGLSSLWILIRIKTCMKHFFIGIVNLCQMFQTHMNSSVQFIIFRLHYMVI